MGRRAKGSPPEMKRHAAKGTAYVRVWGRYISLGRYGSPESMAAYQDILRRWEAGEDAPAVSSAPAVKEIVDAFLGFARDHYRRADGTRTDEYQAFRLCLQPLLDAHGTKPAASFGPKDLKAIRQRWVDAGLSRKTVNKQVGRIRRLYRWAVSEELVPVAVLTALETVTDLQSGRTTARDLPPVLPAPDAAVEATLPFLPRQLAAMVRLQLATGMRPDEVCAMRGADLDLDGDVRHGGRVTRYDGVWVYQPGQHKNALKGVFLAYFLGPEAQAVLRPWLRDDPEEYLFQPREADAERRAALRASRATPVMPWEHQRDKVRNPKRRPGGRYRVDSYGHAVGKACEAAGVDPWSPGRLRHNFLTRVERALGLEAAQKSVMHRSPNTTLVYVERDLRAAADTAAKMG